MSTLCEKLYPFIDGELSEEECKHVRGHLGRCDACAHRFQEALQLDVLAAEAFRASSAPSARRDDSDEEARPHTAARSRARSGSRARFPLRSRVALGLAAAAALVVGVYVSLPSEGPSAQLWLAEAPTRRLEARLSFDALDKHRPFVPMRSEGSSVTEPVPLSELARLDEEKDAIAIAAAFLVRGDAEQARSFLETATPSPDRDNDLAVVALQRGELHEALRLLERVLNANPGHSQARWNRALVLRDLGQRQLAAEAFEEIAARGELGWSEEAERNARSLRQQQAP